MNKYDVMVLEHSDAYVIIERLAKELHENQEKKFISINTSDINGMLIKKKEEM